jgi:hypothetical protein
MTKYVLVTTISSFRHRYAVPVDAIVGSVIEETMTEEDIIGWAKDSVTFNEVKEFSQLHIGETITDSIIVSEKKMLKQFDVDNDYLQGWDVQKKIEWVNNWEENPDHA